MGWRSGHLLAFVAWLFSACATPAETTAARLRDARFVLLGEVHDNPQHHRERAALLSALLADGRPAQVLFEQMPRGTASAIASAPRDAESVATAGRLDRKAWRWPLHQPLLDAALAGDATIAGANLERDDVRAVMRGGMQAVAPELRALLAEDRWTPAQQAVLERSIDAGHCGLLPRERWPAMALAQRARDAAMARAMLDAKGAERVVLIAGNGHVRADVGVPHYLRVAGVPADRIATVGYIEDGDEAPAGFDFVRRSPPAARPDPCEALRR
jgi:uncharacterized iron-regulated protein